MEISMSIKFDTNLKDFLGSDGVILTIFLTGLFLLVIVLREVYKYRSENPAAKTVASEETSTEEMPEQKAEADRHRLSIIDSRMGNQRWSFDMSESITIGRSAARCDIAFESDKSLASRHAIIYFKDDVAFISPFSVAGEVYVQGEKIEGEKELGTQHIIRVGNQVLRVIYE